MDSKIWVLKLAKYLDKGCFLSIGRWHNYCTLNEGKNTNGTYNFAKFFSRTVSHES